MTGVLSGKRALVTGGTRGLGRAICARLAAEGARVAFTYTREDESAAETLSELRAAGVEAMGFRCSVLDSAATTKMVAEIEGAWGAIDVLVNNAGISQNLPLALIEEEDFDLVMDTNVKGTFLTSKAVLRGMIRRKCGVVLNVSSLAGVRMIAAPVHYCASKAAIVGMTEALSKEVARHGIRVVCLAPGLLEGGMGKNLPDYRLKDYLEHCSLGRVGTFDEVAELAAFLVSDGCRYVNGATLVADGGL